MNTTSRINLYTRFSRVSAYSPTFCRLRRFALKIICLSLSWTRYGICKVFLSSLIFLSIQLTANAEENQHGLITADKVLYSQDESIITAEGKVELYYQDQFIIADKIVYNTKEETIHAEGNVSLLETNGNVFFAEELNLNKNKISGEILKFSARLKNNGVIASSKATSSEKDVYVIHNAVYSSCSICEDKEPTWQIKAKQATLDRNTENVYYKHASFEAFGVPVLYTPYFSHPSSDAKSRSGFLVPSFQHIRLLGQSIKTPYYYALAPNKEAIITPMLTEKQGGVLFTNYAHLTKYGRYDIATSITNPTDFRPNHYGRKLRGHIKSKGDFKIQEHNRIGFNIDNTLDKNYLREYKIADNQELLTSSVSFEHKNHRNYGLVESVYFADLRSNYVKHTKPNVLPIFKTYYELDKYKPLGGRIFFGSDGYAIHRDHYSETFALSKQAQRISFRAGLDIPYNLRSGHLFNLITTLNSDNFNTHHYPYSMNKQYSGANSINYPEAILWWRYPLTKGYKNYRIIIEPISNIVYSNVRSNHKIPNEDSKYFQLSDSNLLQTNKFYGGDLHEDGFRVNYGINVRVNNNIEKRKLTAFLGQNYHNKMNPNNYLGGLNEKHSDYVGKATYGMNEHIDFTYRFRLAQKDTAMKFNEIGTNFQYARYGLNLNYLTINDILLTSAGDSSNGDRQVWGNVSYQITPQVVAGFTSRKNVAKHDKSFINWGASIIYYGDCVDLSYTFLKDYTKLREDNKKGGVSTYFKVSLKNLGQ